VGLLSLALLAPYAAGKEQAPPEPPKKDPTPLPLNELRTFADIFEKIKTDYVEEVKDKDLLENAVRGMLSGLDPHSSYLDADAFQDLQEGTTGEFGGLGLEVGMDDGFIKVIAPIDDTPAQRGGIKPGDMIIRLDETPVKGLNLAQAVKMMRGKRGSPITLTILREGLEKPLKLTLVREIIKIQSVKNRVLEPGFGYLRIAHFQAHTGEDTNRALGELKRDNKGELKGLILDLRNNPGGVLSSAVAVADSFLDQGMIVFTKGRVKDSQLEFKATPPDTLKGVPMVVLVNSGSASASEIVAGALQDHKRAVVMGTKTFGKGSVQTVLPMTSNAALKLTTARYYTPSGRSIQAEGIVPDISLDKVSISSVEKVDGALLKEADLAGHLINDNKSKELGPALERKPEGDAKAKEPKPLAATDYDLYEALNLIKGMALLQARATAPNKSP
jgi:carboxyl-terminal processing protease